MKNKLKLLAAGSSITMAVLGASPAFATGTAAGTVITNTASVGYTVGGIAQTAVTASAAVTVDRKIIITTAVVDAAPVSVSPGQNNTVMVFSVTNSSNSVMDIDLVAAAQASGVAVGFSKTSNFAAGSTIVLHTGSASGPVVTYLDEVAADAVTNIYAVDTSAPAIPLSATNGQYAGITLTATARQGGTAGSEGAVVTTTTPYGGANNVFAEPAGFGGDVANNGISVASDVYVVAAPVLSVTKTATVLWDPINGTSTPRAIPGAVVRYCIIVTNAAGGALATAPTITDTLPTGAGGVSGTGANTNSGTTYFKAVANSLYLNGTAGSPTGPCNTSVPATTYGVVTTGTGASGTAASTQITAATTTVSGTLADLAAGSTETLYFDATLQ